MAKELRCMVGEVTSCVDDVVTKLRLANLDGLEQGDYEKLYDEIRENAVTLISLSQEIRDIQYRQAHV